MRQAESFFSGTKYNSRTAISFSKILGLRPAAWDICLAKGLGQPSVIYILFNSLISFLVSYFISIASSDKRLLSIAMTERLDIKEPMPIDTDSTAIITKPAKTIISRS